MFHIPMSSPKIIRMFGLRPDGAVAGRGCCACATCTGAVAASAEVAAMVVPPSRMLRRLTLDLRSGPSFFAIAPSVEFGNCA
jgi:hypothetical protein